MNKTHFSLMNKAIHIGIAIAVGISVFAGFSTPNTEEASYLVRAGSGAQAVSLINKVGGEVSSQFDIINSAVATLDESQVARLGNNNEIVSIVENSGVKLSAAEYLGAKTGDGKTSTDYPEVVGADVVWDAGVTGDGVTIAVLDTGIVKLPSIKKDADGNSGRVVAWADMIESSDKPVDPNGHGSHVAGVMVNSDLGGDDHWNGVAPNADLVAIRVLDENGYGTYESVIAGLQWVVDHKDEYNIKVVNLSLVSEVQAPYWADPLSQAVTAAWANGLTVIVAAGNEGPSPMSISSPGNNPYAITVGAFTDAYTPDDWSDDYIADFSSAGPTLDGFTKPDLVAPGGHIASITPQNSVLNDQYPDGKLPANYFQMAGTSQATGVTSGVAALILSNDPSLSNDQVKMRLLSTALVWMKDNGEDAAYSVWQQGAGRLNAVDAVFSGNYDSANQGMDIWADLNDVEHYEGYSYYNESTGNFELYGMADDEIGKYVSWDGEYKQKTGTFGLLSADYLAITGQSGAWSDHYDVEIAKSKIWAGKSKIWAGKSKIWAGGYTNWFSDIQVELSKSKIWAGKSKIWAGAEFIEAFIAGLLPENGSSSATISNFIIGE